MPPKKPTKFKSVLAELHVTNNATDNTLLTNLLATPKKDKRYEAITTAVPTANYIDQVDTLFLPEDDFEPPDMKKINKDYFKKVNQLRVKDKQKPLTSEPNYLYLLVCVDIATSMCVQVSIHSKGRT